MTEQPVIELSAIGKIVEQEIEAAEVRYPIYIRPYVIMPNHIHMIITIKEENIIKIENSDGVARKPVTLYQILGAIKSRVVLRLGELFNCRDEKFWQESFYDHIIRNDKDLDHEINYINDNPRHHYWGKAF